MTTVLVVKHKLTIGSSVHTLGKETRLVDLLVEAGLDVPVNACRITLSPPKDLALAPGDPVKVELGYGESLALVFTGVVQTADWACDRVTVYAASAFQGLVAARFNLLFEQPGAGDVVADIAGRLKLRKGKVEAGLKLAAYALGENLSAYAHLRELAERCGFDLYADAEDRLVFAKYQAARTHSLTYGEHLLAFALDAETPAVSGVEIYGESPASLGQGAAASSWLAKKDVKGTAGDKSGLMLRMADPVARTQEVAGKIAAALLAARSAERRGVLEVLGAPAIKLGDGVKLAALPTADHSGTYKVTAVRHRLSPRRGFRTTVAIQS